MHYILIGGDGFVGKNLKERGELSYKSFDSGFLSGCVDEASVDLDITSDLTMLEEYLNAIDESFAMINLAAIHHIPYCNEHPQEAIFTNVYGNRRLLEVAEKYGCSKYIFASSGAVYRPSTTGHSESDQKESSDIYSASKILAENDTLNTSLSVCILRFFNIVGAWDRTPHLIPEIADQLREGSSVLNLGNLTTERDYISVSDIVKIIEAVLLDSAPPPILNCGTGIATSGHEIVDLISELRKSKLTVVNDPKKWRKSDRPRQLAFPELLESIYPGINKTPLKEAVEDYLSWCENG